MADDDDDTQAAYRIAIPANPDESDEVQVDIDYRDVKIRAIWHDAKRKDILDLIANGDWFIERAHVELEMRRLGKDLDSELDQLFGGDDQ